MLAMGYIVKRKRPDLWFPTDRAYYWQRPTLAQPRDALPSALQRFTSVFGMGTGGSTVQGSPDFKDLNLQILACLTTQ